MGPKRKNAKAPPAFKPFIGAATEPPYNASSIEKLTFHKFVMQLISRSNIASLLLFTPDYENYKEEFEKFLNYINHCEEPGKSQLSRAIYPLFVYFYFNMVAEAKIFYAKSFFVEFVHVFDTSYRDVLEELFTITDMEEFDKHPYFKNFREKKYIFKMSPDVLEKLNTFLEDIESKALSQTLCLNFYYEEDDLELFSNVELLNSIAANPPPEAEEPPPEAEEPPPEAEEPPPKADQINKNLIQDPVESTNYLDRFARKPPLTQILIGSSDIELYGIDINEDETEICFAYEEKYVCISPFKEGIPVFPDFLYDDDDEDSDSDSDMDIGELDHRTQKTMTFSDAVRAIKYIPHKPHSFLAASGKEIFIVSSELQKVKCESGHSRQIWDIDINSTGSLFCSGSSDASCCLWSSAELSIVRVFAGHEDDVLTTRFHPSGLYFITGSSDHNVRVWNIENSISERCLISHKSPVSLVTCCPDRKIIASADFDGIVKLFDIQDSAEICDIQCYSDNVPDKSKLTSLCFGDEYFLAMCNNTGVIRIWDIRQPKVVFDKLYANIPTLLKLKESGSWNVIIQRAKKF